MLTRLALREGLIRSERVWLLSAAGSVAFVVIALFLGVVVDHRKLEAVKTEVKMLGLNPTEFRDDPIVYIKNVIGGIVLLMTFKKVALSSHFIQLVFTCRHQK